MQGLILDTSCNRSYILLAQDGQVLAYLPMNGGENLSKNLGLEIEELLLERRSLFAPLKEAVRLKPHTASHKIACLDPPLKGRDCGKQCVQRQLQENPSFRADFVAVGTGPGSYTGIRVGAAMAKSLAFGWGVPIMGFCSLMALAPPQIGPFAILTDARSCGFYCLEGSRSEQGLRFASPRLIASLTELDPGRQIYSPHPAQIEKRIEAQEVYPDPVWLADHCCCKAAKMGQSPLIHLPLNYLTSPAVL